MKFYKIPSISFGKICFMKILLVIVLHMRIIIPHLFLFLFNLYGLEKPCSYNGTYSSMEKPSIKTRDSKKVSWSFVSVTTRMSIYFSTVSFNCSNLFLIELIFKFPIITLFAFPNHRFLFYLKNLELCSWTFSQEFWWNNGKFSKWFR